MNYFQISYRKILFNNLALEIRDYYLQVKLEKDCNKLGVKLRTPQKGFLKKTVQGGSLKWPQRVSRD